MSSAPRVSMRGSNSSQASCPTQRLLPASCAVQRSHSSAPGAAFEYGSTHQSVAAAMAEVESGESWATIAAIQADCRKLVPGAVIVSAAFWAMTSLASAR